MVKKRKPEVGWTGGGEKEKEKGGSLNILIEELYKT